MVFCSDARRCQKSNLGGPGICLPEGVPKFVNFGSERFLIIKKKQSVFLQFSYDEKPPTASWKETLTLVI